MLKLVILLLQVDLGDKGALIEAPGAAGKVLLKARTVDALATKTKEFLNERRGEYVEHDQESILIDTGECTYKVAIECNDDELLPKKIHDAFVKKLK